MLENDKIIALRMERQHLTCKANEAEYINLYRDTQPGQNVYWNGFGDPPTLTYRADFNDMEFNRERQRARTLIKGRFTGGNLGWIVPDDIEIFACAFQKPLDNPTERQTVLLTLIERQGPLNIQQMKEETGMLVKEITPALHRLQEAFLLYEDQNDGEWDRGWMRFSEMFPDANLTKYTRVQAIKVLLQRFAYRHVLFDADMARSYFKLSVKDIKAAITELVTEGILVEADGGYILATDVGALPQGEVPKAIYAMHRNDFLVKSNEHWLKEKWSHSYPDTLYYLLVDGEFHGVVVGKFRYTPEFKDVLLDLPTEEATARKDEVLAAIHKICPWAQPPKRYQGSEFV